ncbi:uncharacterized protein [Asterias amurensis]|uniref:uncharacterized protein n=1 Tax=Asterias amurensis TaxID=7602 RepID=UPI003AB1B592
MSEADRKPPQATPLSAEVEPFIPGQSNPARPGQNITHKLQHEYNNHHPIHGSGHAYMGHTHPGSIHPKMVPSTQSHQAVPSANGTGYTLTELPRYLTNCYPFVQDSATGSGHKPEMRWQSYPPHLQPSSAVSSAPSFPPPPPADLFTNHQYPPPIQSPNFVLQYPHQAYFQQLQGHSASQPLSHSQGPVPIPQGSFQGTPPHYPGYYPNYQDGNHVQMGSYHQSNGYGPREPAQRQSRQSSSRDAQLKSRSQGSGSSRDGSSSSSSAEGRRYPKTLVCMDTGSQTDFPDDIANKTLAEKPSMLRRHKSKPRRRSQGNQTGQETSTSTDSEAEAGAVDSDSGYYSPKHAKTNQTSVGMATQDVATGPTVKVQGFQQYPSAVVSAVPRHVTQSQQQVGSAMYSTCTPNSMPPVAGYNTSPQQMGPAANNYPPPQHLQLHHGMPPRLQPQPMVQQQQYQQQQQPIQQHAPQHLSYARILSQQPPQRHPVPVLNQIQPRPPGSMQKQPSLENIRNNQTFHSGYAPGNRTPQQKPGTKYIPAHESADTSQNQDSKRKKKKDRKRAGKGGERSEELTREVQVEPAPPPPALTDMGDFPELSMGDPGGPSRVDLINSQPRSYSAILQQQKSAQMRETTRAGDYEPVDATNDVNYGDIIKPEDLLNAEAAASGIRDGKNARKRRKKAILAAQAAAKEYSEITEEQRQLQENLKKPNKKTKMPIEYDLGDMLAALEKQQQETKAKTQQQNLANKGRSTMLFSTSPKVQHYNEGKLAPVPSPAIGVTAKLVIQPQFGKREQVPMLGHNPLDSSAPLKRGKERETPVKKKPSALKRVILKEREENKRLRTLQETCLSDAEDGLNHGDDKNADAMSGDAGLGLSQDATSERGSTMSFMTSQSDLSPLSQMSPMSMSPLSPGSPLSSGLSSPATGFKSTSPAQINLSVHSRRFREYCNQVLDQDIDACCTTLLQTLVKFQDRQYQKDPTKAKSKRRIVMGLREVTKHLKLKKIKCIIVSPNLERIQSKGGLDEALNRITALSNEQTVPVVFALGRKALGRAVNKLVPVSVVGIFNYDGAQEHYKNLLDLTKSARDNYNAMIRQFQQEAEAASTVVPFSKHRHHLGHYRNLSGCSGISFSSVISEPISEDYPDPEPEVDSRGNEIVREVRFNDAVKTAEYAMAAPVSTLTTCEFVDTDDTTGGYESDRGFSQEGAHSEDSGTVEQGASKTSSETLEAAELDDVDCEDNDDAYDLSDVDEDDELDAIDTHYRPQCEDGEEDEEDEEEEDLGGISILNNKTALPLDKGRIADWVAEAQSAIETLLVTDNDNEESAVKSETVLTSRSLESCDSETSTPRPSSQCQRPLDQNTPVEGQNEEEQMKTDMKTSMKSKNRESPGKVEEHCENQTAFIPKEST